MRKKLKELPISMAERAVYARREGCKNPKIVDVDDEMLPWVYCEKDKLWYSFDGNYSHSSPAEKRKKALERLKKQEAWEEESDKRVQERYDNMIYWSKVRQSILKRDKYKCQVCGNKAISKLHIHHILKRKWHRS